jgi:hypothetical protein
MPSLNEPLSRRYSVTQNRTHLCGEDQPQQFRRLSQGHNIGRCRRNMFSARTISLYSIVLYLSKRLSSRSRSMSVPGVAPELPKIRGARYCTIERAARVQRFPNHFSGREGKKERLLNIRSRDGDTCTYWYCRLPRLIVRNLSIEQRARERCVGILSC